MLSSIEVAMQTESFIAGEATRGIQPEPIIEARSLSLYYPMPKRAPSVRAVHEVDLEIQQGEVLGLVGESGCGKSSLARIMAGVRQASSGEIRYRGRPLAGLTGKEKIQAKLQIQMVFQDPFASLNPRMNVGEIIAEAPRLFGLIKTDESAFISEQMERVGLDPAYRLRYPHQFSGGQRQRIGIARALAVNPSVLVCDEPVSALDVSIQAQILNLFMDLREQLGLTYLFISHDLSVVRHLADRVAIMYLGRIVEQAPAREIFERPNHPYTQALLAEMPRIVTRQRTFSPVEGELPSPSNPPKGCHFHPRCPKAMPICKEVMPKLEDIDTGHLSACHLNEKTG
ncbi:ABC transporter ATP-binding protein [Paracandidimonas soli]|nr:oligopeptide/dipeptide ABC transporter ATP-binding protein [Paracandidimonas soli]